MKTCYCPKCGALCELIDDKAFCSCETEDDKEEAIPVIKGYRCPKCDGPMFLDESCGVRVCNLCDHHLGLARCFCGWSLSGNNGRIELEEMGETIEED